MKILGIETSCDETAAAVVEDGYKLLSNAISSSVDLHAAYGGVVPEIAARSHLEVILPVIEESLKTAEVGWKDIDAISVTRGPGLGGSLLIGLMTARTLAITKNKPLYGVNHVLAHVYANFLTKTPLPGYKLPNDQPKFPLLALIVSGGHSQLVLFAQHFKYTVLGQTVDDAVGEAFDKVAKLLGLPYPGGPSISKAAKDGNPNAFKFPIARHRASQISHADVMQGKDEQRTKLYRYGTAKEQPQSLTQQHAVNNGRATGSASRQADALRGLGRYDFSFSGLKTAVLRASQELCEKTYDFPSTGLSNLLNKQQKADIAASFQRVAIETLVRGVKAAAEEYNPASIVVAGGVAANHELRRQLAEALPQQIEYTDIKLCTDNAAMVAALGYYQALISNPDNPYTLEIDPGLRM